MVGGGGREASFASSLASEGARNIICAIMPHENPMIASCATKTGGSVLAGDPGDPDVVAEFALENAIDCAFVNADEPLANGVTDALLQKGVRTVGGTRAAARIEWDKIYAIKMVERLCPENTPFYHIIYDKSKLADAISDFESRELEVVVKPQGLTGGKGVRVMPEHLATFAQCSEYAESLLDACPGQGVLLVERIKGIEFTIMGLTDGRHLEMSPATYDYPYRFEGDCGPGTGGMGCFAGPGMRLPFMTEQDSDECHAIMQKVIDEMRAQNLGFNGVLNGGFFKTADGIKFMEFNSRFGDPECLNVISLLRTPLSEVLHGMQSGTLPDVQVSFEKKASVSMYLVAKEYPSASAAASDFEVDDVALAGAGVMPYYASCIMTGPGRYRTIKKSRVLALAAISDTIQQASETVNRAISEHVRGYLEHRADIGSDASLQKIDALKKTLI